MRIIIVKESENKLFREEWNYHFSVALTDKMLFVLDYYNSYTRKIKKSKWSSNKHYNRLLSRHNTVELDDVETPEIKAEAKELLLKKIEKEL